MVTVTEDAAEKIREVVEFHELPDGAGLRIEARTENPEQFELTASVETGPRVGDEVVSSPDVRLFLEPSAAAYLDDKVLATEAGEAGKTRVVVRER